MHDTYNVMKECFLDFSVFNFKFMLLFFFQSIDATDTDRIGKYINDAEIGDNLNNCVMKLVMVENHPRLCLFANRDILKGEELRYDYGESNLPWRQVCGKLTILFVGNVLLCYKIMGKGIILCTVYSLICENLFFLQ